MVYHQPVAINPLGFPTFQQTQPSVDQESRRNGFAYNAPPLGNELIAQSPERKTNTEQ